MKRIKILLITNTNHSNYRRMEEGFLESANYAFDKIKEEIALSKLEVKLEILDLKSTLNFLNDVKAKIDDEVLFIFGCAQSQLTRLLLEELKLRNYPIVTPLATASFLLDIAEKNKQKNFFQTTSSDRRRVELLLKEASTLYPGRKIFYYYPDDHEHSYPIGLKKDLERAIKSESKVYSQGVQIVLKDDSIDIPKLPDSGCPIIICAGSKQTVKIAKYLRKKLKRNQIFTFGSNSNLLTHSMIGSVVVCDLDRKTNNIFFKGHLKKLLLNIEDPSISTLIALNVIMQTIKVRESEIYEQENKLRLRQSLIKHINNTIFSIENKEISFSEHGISTANDHTLLRISSGLFKPTFKKKRGKAQLAPRFPKEFKIGIYSIVTLSPVVVARGEQFLSFIENLIKSISSFF